MYARCPAGLVPRSRPLAVARANPGREHRQIRQIAGGLGKFAVRGGGQRGVKPRAQFVEGQPALREVLTQGRGGGGPVGVASAQARCRWLIMLPDGLGHLGQLRQRGGVGAQ